MEVGGRSRRGVINDIFNIWGSGPCGCTATADILQSGSGTIYLSFRTFEHILIEIYRKLENRKYKKNENKVYYGGVSSSAAKNSSAVSSPRSYFFLNIIFQHLRSLPYIAREREHKKEI